MPLPTPSERTAIAEVHDRLASLIQQRRELAHGLAVMISLADPAESYAPLVEIQGDTDGLLELAMKILRVAMAPHDGYHEHIDKVSLTLEDSVPLIVGRIDHTTADTSD